MIPKVENFLVFLQEHCVVVGMKPLPVTPVEVPIPITENTLTPANHHVSFKMTTPTKTVDSNSHWYRFQV